MSFDPNGIGVPNNNILGLPCEEDEADIVILPLPWDVTASYGKGTSRGPEAILAASTQVDFYHSELPEAWNTKVFMRPVPEKWLAKNDELCAKSAEYIEYLESGALLEDSPEFQNVVAEITDAQRLMEQELKSDAAALFAAGKIPAVLGGEHSVPLGLIEAVDALGKPFGILHIDAHADLRDAFEGFEQSHASIMFNVLKNCSNLTKLVQVGIRDYAQCEVDVIKESNGKVIPYFDWDLKKERFRGKTWHEQVQTILANLPNDVYISFDIDGLRPVLCPNTGTPVAGGLELEEVNYLFFELVQSGRNVIAFDLNEVAPGEDDEWDANVGARALWNLVCVVEKSRRAKALAVV